MDIKLKLIILFGPPGVGKGTLAKRVQKEFKWKHISTGLLCRQFSQEKTEFGTKIKNLINNGILIDDTIITEMLQYSLSQNNNLDLPIIIDGYPRTVEQLELFINYLNDKNMINEICFILFDAKDEIVRKRLEKRIICSNLFCENIYSSDIVEILECNHCYSKLIRREDDANKLVEKRLEIYNNIKPNFFEKLKKRNFNVIILNCNDNQDEVYKSFIENLIKTNNYIFPK